MNSRSCRWLIVSALLITACGAWAQQSTPPTPDHSLWQGKRVAQCSAPLGFDQKSIAVFEQQAASGDPPAQCGLGLMYAQGSHVPQDYTQAAFWLRKAAEKDLAEAQGALGDLYAKGWGVSQDYAQAVLWTRKAAEQGDAPSQFSSGLFYYLGQGVPQSYGEAYFWLDLAAAGERNASGAKEAATFRDKVASLLTPADLSREQERARKWFEEHQAKPK